MLGKPKIQLNNFSGMNNKGLFFLEGMSVEQINNQDVLTAGPSSNFALSENTANFSGFQQLEGMTKINHVHEGHIMGTTGWKIFDFHSYISSYDVGCVHTRAATGTGTDEITSSSYPDILTTKNNNILYTSANHLGIGYRGRCASSSSTTKIVDTNGRDFVTLGVSTSAGSNKVFNLKIKEEFTITSITTTSSTNDTLNFTAGAGTNSNGDYFMVFVDNFKKFDTTVAGGSQDFVRQMLVWGDKYYILNNNYLATLNQDETTFNATAKQLPIGSKGMCMDINQDKVLISGMKNNSGELLLWDSYSDGWVSILETFREAQAIKAYQNGWIIVIGAKLYFTDCYQLKVLADFPDLSKFNNTFFTHYNGLKIIDNKVYVTNRGGALTRAKVGVYVYDFSQGWSFIPLTSNGTNKLSYQLYPGAIFCATANNVVRVFTSADFSNAYTTNAYALNRIYDGHSSKYSVMFYIRLPQKMKINLIELNLGFKYSEYYENSASTVTVNYGDGKKVFWTYGQSGISSTSTSIQNLIGSSQPASAGREIIFVDSDLAGERSFITSIEEGGTNNEVWRISPALSGTPTEYSMVNTMDLFNAGKTAFTNWIPEESELQFALPLFYSDKLFLEIVFNTTGVQIDLHGINIY